MPLGPILIGPIVSTNLSVGFCRFCSVLMNGYRKGCNPLPLQRGLQPLLVFDVLGKQDFPKRIFCYRSGGFFRLYFYLAFANVHGRNFELWNFGQRVEGI